MMEAASTSEMSVNFYQTTRRNNPEDSHLHARRRESLRSHLGSICQLLHIFTYGTAIYIIIITFFVLDFIYRLFLKKS
jgi:hypothetical protein